VNGHLRYFVWVVVGVFVLLTPAQIIPGIDVMGSPLVEARVQEAQIGLEEETTLPVGESESDEVEPTTYVTLDPLNTVCKYSFCPVSWCPDTTCATSCTESGCDTYCPTTCNDSCYQTTCGPDNTCSEPGQPDCAPPPDTYR